MTKAPFVSFSNELKQAVAAKFTRCRPECYEYGLARHVRTHAPTAEALLADTPLHDVISKVLTKTPWHNIPSEYRFSSQQSQTYTCHGKPATHYSIAARHVHTESSAWHAAAMDNLFGKFEADRTVVQQPVGDQLFHSGWHAFKSDNASVPLQELSVRWHNLPADERQRLDNRSRGADAGAAPPTTGRPALTSNQIQQATPWGKGSVLMFNGGA